MGQNVELYVKTQSVPRSKHSVSVTKTCQLMLYREIMAVCSEIHTKHINTAVWGRRHGSALIGDLCNNETAARVCVCVYVFVRACVYTHAHGKSRTPTRKRVSNAFGVVEKE